MGKVKSLSLALSFFIFCHASNLSIFKRTICQASLSQWVIVLIVAIPDTEIADMELYFTVVAVTHN